MNARRLKARAVTGGGRITRGNGFYWVPSQTGGARHRVGLDGLFPHCSCEDFELTGQPCKHMIAVRLWLEAGEPGPQPPAERAPLPERPTYKQGWPAYNRAQQAEGAWVL